MALAPVVRSGEAWRIEVGTGGAGAVRPVPSPPGRDADEARSTRVGQALFAVLCVALATFMALCVRHVLEVPWMPVHAPIGTAPLMVPLEG